MNDNNNTRGIASGISQRSDVDLPPSVNTRTRAPAKNPPQRNSTAKPSLHDDIDSDATSIDSNATVVASNTTPVKTVGDVAPPKDGDVAPPDNGDGDEITPEGGNGEGEIPPEDGNGEGDEPPPESPTYDMDTFMFHVDPLSSHSYSDWKEYFNKVW